MKKPKTITTTTLVFEALIRSDDFLTASQLIQVTSRSMNRVLAALHHLRKHQAIQAMPVAGKLYWYATPLEDDRIHVVQEKVEETKPRKPRKGGPRKKKNQDLMG
jgi:hypothetical protein